MDIIDSNKINIFVATGNKDKLARIKKWIKEFDVNFISPHDLDLDLAQQTKTTDEDEKLLDSYIDRAVFKVEKARAALKNYSDLYVLAMDDTGYFPWIDTYIVDLRLPPRIKISDIEIPATTNRLEGAELANFYSHLADLSATEQLMLEVLNGFGETELPDHKFMPVEWWFALAIGNTNSNEITSLAQWKIIEYIRNEKLPQDTEDNGYMIGKVASLHPLGEEKLIGKKYVEVEPRNALINYLGLVT